MQEAARRLAGQPGAVAYFNPCAELVWSPALLAQGLDQAAADGQPAVETFVGIRRWRAEGWSLFDTVGMSQLGLPDMEVAAPDDDAKPSEMFPALINLCVYLAQRGDVIRTGNTADGRAGRKWRAMRCREALPPPKARSVIRWFEESAPMPPEAFFPGELEDSGEGEQAFSTQEEAQNLEDDPAIIAAVSAELQKHAALIRDAAPRITAYAKSPDAILLTAVETGAKMERQALKSLSRGVAIPGFPIIGSTDASLPLRPTLVAGTFDPRPEAQLHAARLSSMLAALYHGDRAESEHDRVLQKIVEDDDYVPQKRVRVPEPQARGFEIYLLGVLLRRDDPVAADLRSGRLALFTAPGPRPAPVLHLPSCLLRGVMPPGLELGKEKNPPPLPAEYLKAKSKRKLTVWEVISLTFLAFLVGCMIFVWLSPATTPPKEAPKGPGFQERITKRLELIERKKAAEKERKAIQNEPGPPTGEAGQ